MRMRLGGMCLLAALGAGCQQLPASFSGVAPGAPAASASSATASAVAAAQPAGAADGGGAQARASELRHLQSLGSGLADIPVAQSHLDRLLEKIQSAGPQPPVYARVLLRPRLTYNAATTPDGFIIVDLGWLKTIDSEPELVALLAHEYGHLRLGHFGAKNSVGLLTHVITMAGAATASKTGTGNYWSMTLVNSGWSEILMPSWSRSQEFEADDFALDTTQALGLAYVPSVRAFLERIQSIERTAERPAPPPAAKAAVPAPKPSPTAVMGPVSEDHPRIEERLTRAQKTVEGRPRVRPAPRAADEWKRIKDSAAFRSGEEEYVLTEAFLAAAREGRIADMAAAAKRLERSSRPLTTGAALAAVAMTAPDPSRQIELLRAATEASNTSFVPYLALANLQRDAANDFEGSAATLQAGLDRFDSPPPQYPAAIEFHRVVDEKIKALPADKRSMQLTLFSLKNASDGLGLRTCCLVYPEWSEACTLASLNEAQKKARAQAQKAKDDEMTKRVERKIDKVFK